MKYLRTMNHDLYGIKKLLLFSNDNNYSSVAVHSLFRDSCLMLYEIIKVLRNDGVLKGDIPIYKKSNLFVTKLNLVRERITEIF